MTFTIKHLIGVPLAAFLILSSSVPPRAAAQSPPGSHLRVERSDEQAILLKLTVDRSDVETVEHGGRTYHRLIIPDMVQTNTPGAPQVPTRGALLGLPTIQGVSVQVLEADYELLSGYHLYPAPGLRVTEGSEDAPLAWSAEPIFTLDQDLYATDAFYPGPLAELGATGYLRDQAVGQVRFYPAQFNPATGEVRLYRRILVRITWEPPLLAATEQTRAASPAFENLLSDALLNYAALERPGILDQPPSVALSGAGIAATNNSTPTLKIGATEDGLYELTYDDLDGAGLDPSSVDPRTIKVSNRGAEIPISVNGEDDGSFDAGDTVLFYGTAIDSLYTAENVYWLTAGGANGQRMATRDGTPAGAPVPTHFPVTLHAEEDTFYWSKVTGSAGQDHWFWGDRITAPAMPAYTLGLHNVSTAAGTTTVRVGLKGRTAIPTINPDHHTRIYLNGTQIDDQEWDGQIMYDHEATGSHDLLDEGNNTITIEGVGDTGALVDQFHLNWIEVDYWDTYVAENDALSFGAPTTGTFQFKVTHFSSSDVQVFDVTDPAHAAIITGTAVSEDGGNYTVRFEDDAQPDTRYLALTAAQRKSPARIEMDQPSSWRSPTQGADYVIITHEDFYTSSLRLASHREITSGLRVATVKVEDVYDEFNHGIFSPQAIRDFLTYAYENWVPPAPTFVLLVGDATYDYKDNKDTGTVNYVPTQLVEFIDSQEPIQTASDNWFVLVEGDDLLPDMFIGRLPAQTVSQADDMVDKIIHYEQHPPDGSWNKDALLVADDDSSTFEAISEQIADLLPGTYTAHRVYAGDYPPGDPTTDIAAAINRGAILVNYAGHGHADGWGQWSGSNNIFERSDIEALDNAHKLPLVTVANCLNGLFAGLKTDVSVAEALLRLKDRGAVAVWASTGLGYPGDHQVLMGEFYETIFQDGEHALGAATNAAKVAAYTQSGSCGELVQTFTLFGDPATQFYHPYVDSTAPANGATDVPIDHEIQVAFNKPMSTTTVALGGEGTQGLPLTPTWSAENTVVTYAHPNFSHGQTLTFTVNGEDEHGNPLGAGVVPSTWSFTVSADDDPPGGAIGVEGGALTDVPVTAAVVITFTEPMRASSVAYACVPDVAGELSWNASGEIARFEHANFEPKTHYTFTVTAAKDVAGNPLSEPLEASFITQEVYLVHLPIVLRSE